MKFIELLILRLALTATSTSTKNMDIERVHTNTVDEHDVAELAQFGYKQELKRDWGLLHNFGISFSIIVSSCLV